MSEFSGFYDWSRGKSDVWNAILSEARTYFLALPQQFGWPVRMPEKDVWGSLGDFSKSTSESYCCQD
jgi:hypothetical protein